MSAQQKPVPGDEVSFLNDVGGGLVLELLGRDQAKVRTNDGFELVYPIKELVLNARDLYHTVSDHQAQLRASDDNCCVDAFSICTATSSA